MYGTFSAWKLSVYKVKCPVPRLNVSLLSLECPIALENMHFKKSFLVVLNESIVSGVASLRLMLRSGSSITEVIKTLIAWPVLVNIITKCWITIDSAVST